MLNKLKAPKGAMKRKKRVGRGEASGSGKTSGRGHKGQRSRSGVSIKAGFEGGQMPLQRRLPKRGFTNIFRKENRIINLTDLSKTFKADEVVDLAGLAEKGLIKRGKGPVKVLGTGEISIPLTVQVNCFSKSAAEKIAAAGGKAEVI
jgi:large subunit ribosomal protein L15